MSATPARFLVVAVIAVSAALARAASVSPTALDSLVAAERAFAADSVARGVRASFLSAFADDGINFGPHPEHTRAEWLKQPAPKGPRHVELDWHPVLADVSSAGDLGYTTGPYVVRDLGPDHRPDRHGYYFSIWKKQADGSWKVIVDAGIRTPDTGQKGDDAEYRPAPNAGRAVPTLSPRHRSAADDLHAREAALEKALRKRGGVALADFAAPEARLHLDGAFPYLGKDALRAAVATAPAPEAIELLGDGLASSYDLGYTWGRADFTDKSSSYFVRVWRLGDDGEFRVTLAWANSVPAPKAE